MKRLERCCFKTPFSCFYYRYTRDLGLGIVRILNNLGLGLLDWMTIYTHI